MAAHPGFHILREELLAFPAVGPLPETARLALARKLKVVMLMRRMSIARLAETAGLSLTTVRAAESGVGVLNQDDLDKLARVLGVSVAELFREPGRTPEERMVMAVLEGAPPYLILNFF